MPTRKRAPRETYQYWFVAAFAWDFYYGYSAHARSRYQDAGFTHTESLRVVGRPTPPVGSCTDAEISFIAETASPRIDDETFRPVIGSMHVQKNLMQATVLIPQAHMLQISLLAALGSVRAITLISSAVFRRQATIRSVSLSTSAEDILDEPVTL